MKAGDVKCPKCGEGFRDVAPNWSLDDDPKYGAGLMRARNKSVSGHCHNGHLMIAGRGQGGHLGEYRVQVFEDK